MSSIETKKFPLNITVDIGYSKLPLNEILDMHEGYIVELDNLIGNTVEIKLNDNLIAHGKVITLGASYGVKILKMDYMDGKECH